MSQVINTNISSLNSQRHLNKTQASLSTALERLSSGKRINSAKDDAAGLGISSRMTSQINGMNQAIRNANDGISMSQTAEGALTTSEIMLQRIRTLATQASNATNSAADREALQTEVSQLTSELNRIAQTTAFNGRKLLDGTMGTAHYQVGANAGELISSNGMNFLTSTYGDHRVDLSGKEASATTTGITGGNLSIDGYRGAANITVTAGQSAREVAEMVNNKTGSTGVTATAKTEQLLSFATGAQSITIQADNGSAVNMNFDIGSARNADAYAQAVNTINSQTSKTGVTAEYFDDGTNYGIKISHATGEDIKVENKSTTNAITMKAFDTAGNATGTGLSVVGGGAASEARITGKVTYDSVNSFSIDDQSGLSTPADTITKTTGSIARKVGTSVSTATNGLTPGNFTAIIGGSPTTIAVNAASSAKDIAAALNSNVAGLSAKAAANTVAIALTGDGTTGFTFKINDTAITLVTADYGDQAALQSKLNALSSQGLKATANSDGKGFTVIAVDGSNIAVQNTDANAATTGAISVDSVAITTQNNFVTVMGGIDLEWADTVNALTFNAGATGLTGLPSLNEATVVVAPPPAAAASTLHSVSELDVSTFDGAQLALAIVDAAINSINSEKAKYGALQARFEGTIDNLLVNVENTSNARSRILDTDFAAETAELSRASILQQAGTAMLAQANQMPQTVLSLIK